MKHKRLHFKRPTPTAPVDTGIVIHDTMQLSQKRGKVGARPWALLLISFFGIFGTIYSFLSMFHFHYNHVSVFAYTLLFWGLFSTLFLLPRKYLTVLIPVTFLTELRIIYDWERFVDGYQWIYNAIYMKISNSNVRYYTEFVTGSQQKGTTLFLLQCIFLIALLVSYFSVSKPNAVVAFVVTFPLPEIGLYYGFVPSYLATILLIAFWIALFSMDTSTGKNKKNSLSAMQQRGCHYFIKPELKRKSNAQSATLMACLTILLFFSVKLAIQAGGYARPDRLNQLRSNIKASIENFEVDDINGSLSRIQSSLGFNIANDDSHNLGTTASVNHSGKTMLEVNVGTNVPAQPIYLRGYVGSIYTGSGWEDFSEATYQAYADFFDDSDIYGIYPQEYLSSFLCAYAITMENGADTPYNYLSVKEKYECKEDYTPYGVYSDAQFDHTWDTLLNNTKDKNPYTCLFWGNPISITSLLQQTDGINFETMYLDNYNQSYLELQTLYQEFVYENYLKLPDSKGIEEVFETYTDLFDTYNDLLSTTSKNNAIEATLKEIETTLHSNATYTLSPGKTPSNRDFVNYFLLENHKGYCSYFASAGVVLCRMAGIPARYVEGYVISETDFNAGNLSKEDTYEIEITDERAHAWAEIYIDHVGWVLYDFTPGTASAFNDTTAVTTTAATTTTATTTTHTSGSSTRATTTLHSGGSTTVSTTASATSAKKMSAETRALLQIIVIGLLVLAAAYSILRYRYRKAVQIRKTRLAEPDLRKRTLYAYAYLLQLLAYLHIVPQQQQLHLRFAKEAEDACEYLNAGELQNATEIAQRADFSTEPIVLQDVQLVAALTEHLADCIRKESKLLRRLYLRFILNLLD